MTTTNPLHIYFLLDRSGSMESIRADVIGGFNTFLAEQKAVGGDEPIFTFVQFDTQDPQETIYSAEPLSNVADLDVNTFIPRGGTPLYDAMGAIIMNAKIRAETRADLGAPTEDIVMVTFTDGGENQSVSYDKTKIFDLVKDLEAKGWTFVYLGANQDSYGEAGAIGYAAGSTQNYLADALGTQTAYHSLSSNMTNLRSVRSKGGSVDNTAFFATKEAENLMGLVIPDEDILDEEEEQTTPTI